MKKAELDKLADWFNKNRPKYNGWWFELGYPGYLVYNKKNRQVYFTPDFNKKGEVDIQEMNNNELLSTGAIKIRRRPISPAWLFESVKPWLDKVHWA